jgi:HK97 family phage prohead protease
MKVKSAPAQVKMLGVDGVDGQPGEFKALVSVFNTVDSVNDVVIPGAFKATLARFMEKGEPIPVVWSHDWDDPFSHIGYTTSAEETPAGLEVTGRLDLDNPKAAQVYRLLKGGRIRDFSFAYDVLASGPGEREGKSVTELHELDVFEVGPTLVGAHRGTELRDIKATAPVIVNVDNTMPAQQTVDAITAAVKRYADGDHPAAAKTGRVLSAKNEDRIRQIAVLAQELLDAVNQTGSGQQNDEKAMPAQPANAEEPQAAPGVKADEPARQGAASSRLRTALALLEAESALY